MTSYNLTHRIKSHDPEDIKKKKRRFHLRGQTNKIEHIARRFLINRNIAVQNIIDAQTDFSQGNFKMRERWHLGINRTVERKRKRLEIKLALNNR